MCNVLQGHSFNEAYMLDIQQYCIHMQRLLSLILEVDIWLVVRTFEYTSIKSTEVLTTRVEIFSHKQTKSDSWKVQLVAPDLTPGCTQQGLYTFCLHVYPHQSLRAGSCLMAALHTQVLVLLRTEWCSCRSIELFVDKGKQSESRQQHSNHQA